MSGLSPAEEKQFARVFVELGRAGSFSQLTLRAELLAMGWTKERIDAAFGGMRPDFSRYSNPN